MNPNLEVMSNLTSLENSNPKDDQPFIPLSNESFLCDQYLKLSTIHEKFARYNTHDPCPVPAVHSLDSANSDWEHHKINEDEATPISNSLGNSSVPPVSSGDIKSLGGRKRKRSNAKEEEKPREVIHVRAKRGQATDSHSLAERVRREKINQKLRCLQDLVPGCYKKMGMAVMLDVIINYVQSLQTQIEFLSMKLSVASRYYDFNSSSEIDAVETMQATNAYELQEVERMEREGYEGSLFFHPTWPL